MKIAIIGASKDRAKFGNKAVRAYKQNDHVVFPVNPHDREIEGLIKQSEAYKTKDAINAASLTISSLLESVSQKEVLEAYLKYSKEKK